MLRLNTIGKHETVLARLNRALQKHWMLYALLIPGLLFIFVFCYMPMYGVTYAFREYSVVSGAGKWIGLEVFKKMFASSSFTRAFKNNIIISILKVICGFPVPIILSLMINELRTKTASRFIQTAIILPNFISWFIISGLLFAIFNLTSGAIPSLIRFFNPESLVVNVLSDKSTIRSVVILSYIWQSAGMGTIVYLAAITGINQDLYEAAIIDGAGRWQQMWHITLASIRSTIIIMFIFRIGNIMSAGFNQIYALSNSLVVSKIDIIDTYVYRIGLEQAKFSEATAAGLFKSVIGFLLVLMTNALAKRIDTDSGIM
ncbi:MAG: sugar ABC transporter permease [Clostridiales bacterium]|nr:sugar ABC transporter permease [Clostridiales bacterium]